MRSLARSIISLCLFLELSSDEEVDPDSALSVLGGIAWELQSATDDEKVALRNALNEMITEERNAKSGRPRQDVIEYYQHFMEYIGIDPES